ncbi:MAG: DegV family protein [Bacilli bacterium]|nr:DegV family protein [Bacilli bacterium]
MEKNYVLFIDSDSDITLKQAKEKGVEMISMPYIIDDKEIYPYKDFEEFDSKPFYDLLRKGTLPKTCGLSPVVYEEYFEPFFKQGKDILYAHLSTNMTGSISALMLAVKELKEKYPLRRFEMIDTKGVTAISYVIDMEIIKLYEQGKSIDEILAWAKEEIDHFACYFYADDLKFFGRSGRVSGLASFMGNVIGLRPLITINSEGRMDSCGKAVGRNAAIKKVLGYVEELQDHMEDYTICVGHSDNIALAHRCGLELKKKYGDDLKIDYVVVNPTIGSHCGPDCVGVAFHAKHR